MDPTPLDIVVAVPPTPFLEDGALDEAGFERALTRAVDGGLPISELGPDDREIGRILASWDDRRENAVA